MKSRKIMTLRTCGSDRHDAYIVDVIVVEVSESLG